MVGAILEIADGSVSYDQRWRTRGAPLLFGRYFCRISSSIGGVAGLPNGNDVTRVRDVHRGVTRDEEQVSAFANSHLPAIGQTETSGGLGSRGAQRFLGRQAGRHQ